MVGHIPQNAQGDIIGLLDSSNKEVVTYSYDSWGNNQVFQDSSVRMIYYIMRILMVLKLTYMNIV